MKPFTGRERIITTDNFFTSTLLAAKLDKKVTIVGTIHGNKRELSKFLLFIKSNTFTIYKSKPNKKILLLSSKRKSIKIKKSYKCILETMRFYNNNKFSITNQMTRKYSLKSKSRKWLVWIFFTIVI
ncbi:LOW QUALITY PROTEIN: piggyBac transposable element-derived protein 4-like [Vespula squamosa]|uniref:PiggyBac transposable element-derived protein 4-like n=1 Tax=Vespula squamosa TaxID=30214 RepID=A0ABD2AF63_VESSQ